MRDQIGLCEQLKKVKDIHPDIAPLLNGADEYSIEWQRRVDRMFQAFNAAGLGDKNFVRNFAEQPTNAYWELLLGCTLLLHKVRVSHHDRGPDFKCLRDEGDVWIEATCVSPGELSKPDTLPPLREGEAAFVPEDSIQLRILSAIQSKLQQWERSWRDIVRVDDIVVIAINTGRMGFSIGPEYVANSLYGVGPLKRQLDAATLEIQKEFREQQLVLTKGNGATVSKAGFRDESLSCISAIIHGHFNYNWPPQAAAEAMSIFHNSCARNPLPRGCLGFGREFRIETSGQQFRIVEC